MKQEIIKAVQIDESGEIQILITGEGDPSYQYVYRAAAGVYWDNDKKGFKIKIPEKTEYPKWFKHVVSVVKDEAGINLKLSKDVQWNNVSSQTKNEILNENDI